MGGGITGGGSGGCFSAGTLVLIPNIKGASEDKYLQIPIEDLKVGDKVISFNEQLKLEEAEVTKVWVHEPRLVMSVDAWNKPKALRGTPDHLVYADCVASFTQLKDTPTLRDIWGGVHPIIDRHITVELEVVYNLTVFPNNTYVANGFLVHNMGGGGGGSKEVESQYSPMWAAIEPLIKDAVPMYQQLYKDYYWPTEQTLAGNDLRWTQAALGQDQNIQDYLIKRAGEVVGVADETNPMLDESRKDLIRRLVEGEDVLADRYRSQASQDTANSFGQQRTQMQNQMSQLGINPNSGAWASSVGNLANQEALGKASAMTKATWDAEDKSLERMNQAQSLYTNPSRLLGEETPSLTMKDIFGAATSTSQPISQTVDGGSGGSGIGSILGAGASIAGKAFGK